MTVYLEEKVSDTAVQIEVIPTSAKVKENVALALCRAAKNGKLLSLTFLNWYMAFMQ